jgi:hypothetical protein
VKRYAGWLLVAAALVAYDVYLLAFRLSDVQGNCEAQVIIVTPMFIAQHLWTRRQHARLHGRMDAQDAAMAETHRKVHELHALHVEGVPPEKRIARP